MPDYSDFHQVVLWAADSIFILVIVVVLVFLVFSFFFVEFRVWILLWNFGASTTGKCTKKTEEPDGSDGYTRTLYYEFQARDSDGMIRTYSGDSWVPLRLFRRIDAGSNLRIRFYVKNPTLNRIDEDDYRNWGFRSENEGGGDSYPDTQRSAFD
jgi:hypothetical protein